MNDDKFGLRWEEWNKKDQKVTKEKFFSTSVALEKYILKLEEKDNFSGIVSFCEPRKDGYHG